MVSGRTVAFVIASWIFPPDAACALHTTTALHTSHFASSEVELTMVAISSLDLPSALGQLAATRAAGGSVPVRDYSAVLEACAQVSPMALYRVFEEAISDGVRVNDLPPLVRDILRGQAYNMKANRAHSRGPFSRELWVLEHSESQNYLQCTHCTLGLV